MYAVIYCILICDCFVFSFGLKVHQGVIKKNQSIISSRNQKCIYFKRKFIISEFSKLEHKFTLWLTKVKSDYDFFLIDLKLLLKF